MLEELNRRLMDVKEKVRMKQKLLAVEPASYANRHICKDIIVMGGSEGLRGLWDSYWEIKQQIQFCAREGVSMS